MNDVLKELSIEERKQNLSFIFYLTLASISFLFVGLTGAYIYFVVNSDMSAIKLHYGFFIATLFIVIVSLLANSTLSKIKNQDLLALYNFWVLISVFLFAFLIAQISAWITLFTAKDVGQYGGMQYLYMISIVHALHVIGGLPFHFSLLNKLSKLRKSKFNGESSLLLYRFKLLINYWHFLDVLWLILMTMFTIFTFL